MTILEQLAQWVAGNPIHDHSADQCCPDFSCCDGDLASEDERQRFAHAYLSKDDDVVSSMLVMFLGRMLIKKYGEIEMTTSKDIIH